MKPQEFEFVDVAEKAKSLGCNVPIGLALLPRNFEHAESKEELLHESTVSTVRVLFRQNNISETPLELEGDRFPQLSEKAFAGWIGPIIFVSYALLGQDPNILSLVLGVISNYLTDFFKGMPGVGKVRLDVVIETKAKSYRRIHYEGPLSGLEELPEIIKGGTDD